MRKSPIACLLAFLALIACARQETEWSSVYPVFVNMVKEVQVTCNPNEKFFTAKPVYYASPGEAKANATVRPAVIIDNKPVRGSDDEHRKSEDVPSCKIGDLAFQVEIEDKVKNLGKYGSKTYWRENPGKYRYLFESEPYFSGILVPYVTIVVYRKEDVIGLVGISKYNPKNYLEDFWYQNNVVGTKVYIKGNLQQRESDPYLKATKLMLLVETVRVIED